MPIAIFLISQNTFKVIKSNSQYFNSQTIPFHLSFHFIPFHFLSTLQIVSNFLSKLIFDKNEQHLPVLNKTSSIPENTEITIHRIEYFICFHSFAIVVGCEQSPNPTSPKTTTNANINTNSSANNKTNQAHTTAHSNNNKLY